VTAKGLRKNTGESLPNSVVRFRILNSDPNNPSEQPTVSQVQVRHHVETSCLSGCPLSRIVTVRALVFSKQHSNQTPQTTGTCDPVYNQDFLFKVLDTKNARLDCVLYDSNIGEEGQGFLGEVMTVTAAAN
jgi:hypothetical protein